MAVFTTVSPAQAGELAHKLALGELTELRGISAGIENTNYFLTTSRGEWVLTLFERLTREQLPFYLALMKHLAARGIPVPDPQADAQGHILHELQGKPAAVVNRLTGGHQLQPGVDHCRQVGAMLARMHLAAQDCPTLQPNLRGLAWWQETAAVVRPHLTPEQQHLLDEEVAFQRRVADDAHFAALPRGPIHGDLFRDNVMFNAQGSGEHLSGFFDFYFAGVDCWLLDIAICLNDWCADVISGVMHADRAEAFLAAYSEQRAISKEEHTFLPAMLRAAALRFWISRLWDFHLPRDASMLTAHDPTRFERVLTDRRNTAWNWHETRNTAA